MRLNIGPLTIELSGVTEQEIPVNSRLFLDRKPADKRADRHYTFHFCRLSAFAVQQRWQAIFRRNDIVIFRKEERETRLLAIGNLNACYALYQEKDERNADIYFIEGLKRELQTDTLFISCLLSGTSLSARGCYILHCAFRLSWASHPVQRSQRHWQINMPPCGAGIFPTPGYSMATVPCSVLPNGGYEITGWPVCGSSGICHNERHPLKTIVFIEQASDNAIRPQTALKHFKALCSQVTINWWNPKLTGKALDDLLVLTRQTSISTYACNMNPEAAFTPYTGI